MANRLKLILNLLLLFCLVACGRSTNVSPLLEEAEEYMNERPDSALYLLDSITYREDMSEEQNALWCLLHTQAQDKNRIEHTSDSLIQIAVKYYEKTNLDDRKMQAYYYCGVVFYDLNDALQAQEYYLKAYEVGKNLNEYSLLGRLCANLGTLYTYQELYQPALAFQTKAMEYFQQVVDSIALSLTFRNIARIYVCKNQLDSAICYYSKVLSYTSDSHSFYILNELADTYGKKGDYLSGLAYAKEAYAQIGSPDDSCLISFTLGDLFLKMDQLDSAYSYLSFCQKSSNIQTLAGIYYSLGQLEKQRGNYQEYIVFQEKYEELKDSIEEKEHAETLARLQSLYDYQLVEKDKEYYRQKVDKKTKSLYLVSLLGGLLFASAITMFIYRDKRKQRKEDQLNQSLRLQEQEYRKSQQYLKDRDVSIKRLQKQLELELHKREFVETELKQQLEVEQQKRTDSEIEQQNELFSVQQEKAELEKSLALVLKVIDKNRSQCYENECVDFEKMKTLFFSSDLYHGLYTEWPKMDEEKWQEVIDWIDHLLYIDFTRRIKDLYPGVTKTELQICYLIKLNIPVGRIASLLCITSQAISLNKNRLYTKLTRRKGSAPKLDKYISNL